MKRHTPLLTALLLTACTSSSSADDELGTGTDGADGDAGTLDASSDDASSDDADASSSGSGSSADSSGSSSADTSDSEGDDSSDEGDEGGEQTPDFEAVCEARGLEGCYFVSNTGNYPAGSEGHQLVIEEVSSQPFSPGDIILFARGDTWRHTGDGGLITLSSSGDAQDDIQFGAYGSGELPTFLGSLAASEWSELGGGRWESATEIPLDPSGIAYGAEVFFGREDGDAFFGRHEDSVAGLDKEGDWTWSNGRITVYAPENPGTAYPFVEVPQGQRLILLDNQEHLSFDSLRLRFMVSAGFYDSYGNAASLVGLSLSNSEIGYIGVENSGSAYGLSLERSGIHIANNRIHDCGRRSISLVLYETPASTISDVVIEHNHFHGGYHTTGVDIQSNTAASGGHLIEDIVIRNNLFAGDPSYDIQAEDGHSSNHIFMNQDEGSTLREVYIYGNLFTYAQGSSIKTSGGDGVYIHHNTFYGFNPSYDNYQAQIFGGNDNTDTVIVNNIFYNDATDNRYACIEFGQGLEAEYTIDRNLYYASDYAHARLLWVDSGTSFFFDDDWADYQAQTGFDANSPAPADPLFGAAPDDLRPGDGSPAIGHAVAVEWIDTDYYGDPLHEPPDLGAIQH
ncbi:right-handed parallel beta-helix repeat-containing protein [Pseudenhygromyxa sp. WMMC2535]|uniref:right-handed parallel beta-helix repeat-containing protein n=1 Tax=Pseudenhygromyxa sp. WMMC2535 TaxID=2712867 RepID=UPI001557C501|nr:right-handed parallel beta-helix repeat-containing protein [Pseudenhygromyxa sp. WMMC2535]NVB36431.1 right-handed parallel beta-helix repeat-containing protein [Pseudenhygromyxa sp. WMMC2535]